MNNGDAEKRRIETMNGVTQNMKTHRINVTLASVDGNYQQDISLYISQKVTGNTSVFNWNTVKNKWPHLRSIRFENKLSSPRSKYDILIGTDLTFLHHSKQDITAGPQAPVARLTSLGWTAMGPIHPSASFREFSSANQFNT